MKTGKKVYLVTASKAITKKRLNIAEKLVKDLGFEFKYSDSILEKYYFYAGSPESRAEEINSAYRDKDSDYILTVAGGMGMISVLDKIDLDMIKKSDKVFVGYSDVTLLLNYINQKTGKRCFHGPNFGKPLEMFDKKTINCFFDALNKKNYRIVFGEKDIFKKGFSEASIVGGNLRLLSRSLGTPFEIDTKNKIVFLEADSKTESWVFDMLWQLKQAGKFDNVEGIILGHFTKCGKDIELYLKDFFKDFNCPVIMNQPVGHAEPNLTIPIGEKCIIDTEKGFWGILF